MHPTPDTVVPLEAPLPDCRHHRAERAGWRCTACASTLCPGCAVGRRAQTVLLVACAHCGGAAEPLLTHRARVPLARRLRPAWRYVFSSSGLQVLAGVSLVLTVLGWLTDMTILFLKPVAIVMYGSVLWATFYKLARESARGERELSPPDFHHFIEDGIVPGLRGIATFALPWLPAFVYATVQYPLLLEVFEGTTIHAAKLADVASTALWDPVMWGLLLLALAWLPAVLLLAAAGQSIDALLNIGGTVRRMRTLGRDYVLLCGVLAVLGGAQLLAQGLATGLRALDVFLVSRLLAEVLTLIIPFTAAHVLGLVLLTRGDALGHGLEHEYLEPVLGDTPPKLQAAPLHDDAPFSAGSGGASFVEVQTPAQRAVNEALTALGAAVEARDLPLAMSLYASLRQQPRVRVPPEHHLFIGQAAAVEGDFPLAVHALESAADVAPEDPIAPRALVILARVLGERMQDAPRAEEVYRYVLHRYPDTAAARYARERVTTSSD
ncbi:hypothetical protein [Comamonas sp. JC664]|uniref:tetratricopeptide repeat protein n=1 Tax=Comamonas sp. JC664 TaxID=2801917 RepID=UPI0017483B04|nr:hypothetical protein [Comamonas sp. JC664]MBL0693780.1 hypothetical protein [Comamonas sp. JC664]GHG74352.1 hypothetical protein GCM10012319_22080 [Comamonas sp. KCTC 72670]